jgi:hypothetical protein
MTRGGRGLLLEIELTGLDELREALKQLPEDLAAEGQQIVENHTEFTANSLAIAYPIGDTGNLRKGIKTEYTHTRFGTVGRVRSTSPHAHLWEFGTQDRETREGWKRGQVTPRGKETGLVPISERWRKVMNRALVELVKRAGFQVTGVE